MIVFSYTEHTTRPNCKNNFTALLQAIYLTVDVTLLSATTLTIHCSHLRPHRHVRYCTYVLANTCGRGCLVLPSLRRCLVAVLAHHPSLPRPNPGDISERLPYCCLSILHSIFISLTLLQNTFITRTNTADHVHCTQRIAEYLHYAFINQ